jgi:DNA-binding response OmpR family regulator
VAVADMIRDKEKTGLRVLVVEDDMDTSASVATLLRMDGHEVQVARDGRTAVRMSQESSPDVALLDIRLPGMDGYEVARRLQERATKKKPLLIAITGCGREQDRRRSAEAGIDLHLVKPVDPEALQRLLRRFPRDRSGRDGHRLRGRAALPQAAGST